MPNCLANLFTLLLYCQGQAGVEEVLKIIKEEFRLAMALSG